MQNTGLDLYPLLCSTYLRKRARASKEKHQTAALQDSSADEGASHLLKGWRRNTNMERTGPCCEIADQNLPLGPRIPRPREKGERAAKGKRCEVEGSVDFAIYFFEFWISTILYPNYPNFVNLG